MPDKKMYILTRFNLALQRHGERFDYDDYMRKRIEWFRLTTVPSVLNQTWKNFTWLVLLDKETPAKWKRELISPHYKILEIDTNSDGITDAVGDLNQAKIGLAAMRQCDFRKDDLIITARLDNDDCIARQYVARVRKALRTHRQGVQFVQGHYWYHAGRLKGRFYNSVYRNNMFPAVCERGDSVKTVFEIDHPRLYKKYKMQYEKGGAMWLYNWLPDGLNLQNFTSRFAKRSGYPRCQGATLSGINASHLKRIFGLDINNIKETLFIKEQTNDTLLD